MMKFSIARFLACLTVIVMGAQSSVAKAGFPVDWQIGFQDPASPSAEELTKFHDFLLWIIGAISAFVLGLLIYVILRYNK